MTMTIRDGQREYFYDSLDRRLSSKGLRGKYEKNFGNKYSCNSSDYKLLCKVFYDECKKFSIKTRMDIFKKNMDKGRNLLDFP